MQKRHYNGLWINNKQITANEENLNNAFLSQTQNPALRFYEKQEFTFFQELLTFLNQNIKTSW
ncbi:MAG: hypothetical protein OHM56_12135 [Spiroplasma phoeniceum]|nr:MAG: hypothetical protein OHM57_11565 [Spiroplasma phoeniceum]UZQ32265.1 MAG: hypothetical protein OHM56_12135 [Spiroplasma phoeniceum]